MSNVAFTPEEATEALKEFIGQIVEVDYSEEPFGFKGAPEILRKGKVLCLKIRTDVYDKEQLEWFPPSKIKKTKWLYLIEALTNTGVIREVSTAGKTDDERITAFANSLLGMEFRWQETECESLVKEKGGATKKFSVLLPVEYIGRKPIEEVGTVRQTTVDEAVPSAGGID